MELRTVYRRSSQREDIGQQVKDMKDDHNKVARIGQRAENTQRRLQIH